MFKTSSPSPARAIEFVRRNIVKMATEADWLKLKLPDLKAALLGAGGDASGLRSKQSYAEALVALGVALPGGGGAQLLGGGAGGGGVGPVDVRSAKEQLAGCVADAELEKGLVGVLPSAFDASLPADVLGWLVASLFVVLGGPLTRENKVLLRQMGAGLVDTKRVLINNGKIKKKNPDDGTARST